MLNLWQKNEVFTSEVIQPLFDLANPNSELSKQMDDQMAQAGAGGLQKIAGTSTKQGLGSIQLANMAGMGQSNQLLSAETQVGNFTGLIIILPCPSPLMPCWYQCAVVQI